MIRFVVRRLAGSTVSLVAVIVLVFLAMQQIPGSPWSRKGDAFFNVWDDSPRIGTLRYYYGLDQPLWHQLMRYFVGDIDSGGRFVCGLVCLNLGPSLTQTGRTNQDILFAPPPGQSPLSSRFGYSLRLAVLALVFAVGLGLPLGIASAALRGSTLDHGITLFTTIVLSVPTFALGLLLMVVFASGLHLIKFVSNWTDPGDWVMPAVIVGLPLLGSTARLTRGSMIDVLYGDYVRTARGKGLHEGVIFGVHVFRNALVPVLAYIAPAAVELLAMGIIVEYMFAFPGMGRLFVDALVRLDYAMALSLTAVYGALIALATLVIELLRGAIDPRLRGA